MFLVKRKVAEVSAVQGFFLSNIICPTEEIYHGDTILFGGTIFNNQTFTYKLDELVVEFFHPDNQSVAKKTFIHSYANLDLRNVIEPDEAMTLSFEGTIKEDELPNSVNYTLRIRLTYNYENNPIEIPFVQQFGDNVTIDILPNRIDAPPYIWGVFTVLLGGIITFVILAVVSWVRDKRSR